MQVTYGKPAWAGTKVAEPLGPGVGQEHPGLQRQGAGESMSVRFRPEYPTEKLK